MFCSSCGAKLPDGSKFCFNCGQKLGHNMSSGIPPIQDYEHFVPAKCTSCGAALQVDSNQEAAVCPYCSTPYIVKKAIQNYHISAQGNVNINGGVININGKNIENLLKRAEQYALQGDFDQALEYYNEVLDSDVNSSQATNGIKKINDILNSYVYLSEDTSQGKLELKKGRLILTTKITPEQFELTRIFGLDIVKKGFFSSSKSLQFTYDGIPQRKVSLSVNNPEKWFMMIEDAKMGKYPQMKNLGQLFEGF